MGRCLPLKTDTQAVMLHDLFLSSGYIRRRTQRTNKVLRLAGAFALLTVGLQVAAAGGYYYINRLQGQEDDAASHLASEKQSLEDKLKPFNDAQSKYATIIGWMPVLKNRLPLSAVITFVQDNFPRELALHDLVIRTDDSAATPAGYRLPKKYALDMIGYTRSQTPALDLITRMFGGQGVAVPGDPARVLPAGLTAKNMPLPPGSENIQPALWHVVVSIDPTSAPVRTLFGVQTRKSNEPRAAE